MVDEIKKWTPAEAWEGFMGGQSAQEFMHYSPGMAIEAAVADYVANLNNIHGTDYTPKELELIEMKLVQYLHENLPLTLSKKKSIREKVQTVKEIQTEMNEKFWMREAVNCLLENRLLELNSARGNEHYRENFEKVKEKAVAEISTITTVVVGGLSFVDHDAQLKEHLEELYAYLSQQKLNLEWMQFDPKEEPPKGPTGYEHVFGLAKEGKKEER